VNHALGTSLGWFAKTSSYVDLVSNQGMMTIMGIRLNATKYLKCGWSVRANLYWLNTYSGYEVTQETKGAVLNTAKMLKLFVRQLVSIKLRIPSDDEPIDTVREPRQVMALPMDPPTGHDRVPRTADDKTSE